MKVVKLYNTIVFILIVFLIVILLLRKVTLVISVSFVQGIILLHCVAATGPWSGNLTSILWLMAGIMIDQLIT